MVEHRYEMKIKKIEKKTVSTEDYDEDTHYILKAESALGVPKISITNDQPFIGLKPKMTITVLVNTPQMTLPKEEPGSIGEMVSKSRVKKGAKK